ncbi:SNX11 protein, partial [Crypturellus undulatus]|nr:SNX11 protein [Crypturellus undulatus]
VRRVVQNVVLLSDSRLHLFLQSQLSVPEMEACVEGRGSLTVTDAVLHYAMSRCGWAQDDESRPAPPGAELHGRHRSCVGLDSPQGPGCLEPFPPWSDVGAEAAESPEAPPGHETP